MALFVVKQRELWGDYGSVLISADGRTLYALDQGNWRIVILDAGKLERVLPEWSLPPLPVSLVFPSWREVSPVVRAFVDYMREANATGKDWLRDPLM